MIQTIINNFQSIKEAKIKVEGMTLLVGESSQGKSACLRALQAACTNRFKAGQVRHGEDHALIRIKVPESNDVLSVLRPWAGGSPKIKLGSLEFSKLGRTLPSQVTNYLNLGFLDVSGESYSCNFHSQFQPPLLLAYSQPKVMELLSASTALDDLKEAKEVLMEQRSINKGAIAAVESIINNTIRDIVPVDLTVSKLTPLVSELTEVSDILTEVESKESIIASLKQYIQEIHFISSKQQVLEELSIMEVTFDTINSRCEALDSLQSLLSEDTLLNAKLDIIQDIVDTYDEELESSIARVDLLSELRNTFTVCSNSEQILYKKLELINSIIDVDTYLNGTSRVRYAAFSELTSLKSQYDILSSREEVLLEVVDKHICPVCGSHVSYND